MAEEMILADHSAKRPRIDDKEESEGADQQQQEDGCARRRVAACAGPRFCVRFDHPSLIQGRNIRHPERAQALLTRKSDLWNSAINQAVSVWGPIGINSLKARVHPSKKADFERMVKRERKELKRALTEKNYVEIAFHAIRIQLASDIFQRCGNFNVFGQMDQHMSGCTYPQIELLDRLHKDAPHATWLMPLRNVSEWLGSVNRWNNLRDRFGFCNFHPHLDFEGGNRGDEKNDQKMMALYCNHVQQIRQFVVDHPTLSLVEFRIEDNKTGSFLEDFFPVDPEHWGQHNAKNRNKKKH